MSNTIRERLLAQNAKLIRAKQVEVPLEDGTSLKVEVRSPTMGQASQNSAQSENPEQRLRGIIKTLIGVTFDAESGQPIFTLADEDLLLQAPANGGWVALLISALVGLNDEAQATAKN